MANFPANLPIPPGFEIYDPESSSEEEQIEYMFVLATSPPGMNKFVIIDTAGPMSHVDSLTYTRVTVKARIVRTGVVMDYKLWMTRMTMTSSETFVVEKYWDPLVDAVDKFMLTD